MTTLGQAYVIRGDARTLPLPDDSVDLIVSSPPYWALRSYQDGGVHYDGQIGSEPTPAEFVDALLEVTRECVRVLKPSGSLWINLGDKYVSYEANRGTGRSSLQGTDDRSRPVVPPGTGLAGGGAVPNKSLMGLPWRYALRCIDELGLILRAEVIWSKPNGLPESVTDRVRRSHEQWFHFTRQARYYAAMDEIRESHARSWGGADSNLVNALPNPLGKLPGSTWVVPTEPLNVPPHVAHARCCQGTDPECEEGIDHFAAFPSECPKRIIRGWAPLTGVCTACGEGRRPASEAAYDAQGRTTNGPKNEARRVIDQGVDRVAFQRSGVRKVRSTTITGYVCGCNDTIKTPTGRARPGSGPTGSRPDTADPSRVVGRAGMARERAEDAGTRDISRWEQRHEADQMRRSPHRADMEALCGKAFAHYIRTDRAGARPLPEDVRQAFRAKGWLQPAPPYTPAPTQPAIVLDPFGGTGTVAMVAKALGMVGITVDLSADYGRLAKWRTNDRDQLAKVLDIAKPTGTAAAEALAGHADLFTLLEETQ